MKKEKNSTRREVSWVKAGQCEKENESRLREWSEREGGENVNQWKAYQRPLKLHP